MESISVKNFRSILESGEIEICPLTVAVGRNSAGKSSFVRLFPLLKQTLERKISDTLLWYGDYVDFGDFSHTVFRKNCDKPIEIAFTIMTYSRYWRKYGRRNDKNEFPVRVELSIKEKYIEKVCLKFYDQCVVLNIDESGKTRIIINGEQGILGEKQLLAFRETGDIIPTIYEKMMNNNEQYLMRAMDTSKYLAYCKEHIYPSHEKKEDFLYSALLEDIDIKIGTKEDILSQLKRINSTKFEKMNIGYVRFQKLNNYIIVVKLMELIERINDSVSEDMKQTSYLKPIRAMVNRFYRVQGISIDELDADGSNLPMILKNMKSSELRNFEKWSKEKFGVVFSVTSGEGHISLIIKNDVGEDTETNVADTGYGYSQMLPIVMILWMTHNKNKVPYYRKERTIVIEQPELHLHPAYQAKMVDVFVNIIKESQNNGINLKIIIETHSEAMINRIGSLISESKIDAENVNILVFDKVDNQTNIKSKRFNREGLLLGWPIGFFAAEED